jgi:hypothetical protein
LQHHVTAVRKRKLLSGSYSGQEAQHKKADDPKFAHDAPNPIVECDNVYCTVLAA